MTTGVRINERIRVREIRVIDDTGQQLGIMPPPQALTIARQKGLDLVEISPTAVPPVCRIMDYGKYQYQEQKRAREAKKHQKIIEVKEIKFRPKVDEHDYQFKKKHIERFLADGDKVKATIFFRGREMAHPEIGRRILERLIEELAEVGHRRNRCRGRKATRCTRSWRSASGNEQKARGRRAGGRRRAGVAAAATREHRPQNRRKSESRVIMPKLKTHRGAAKRFKKTGTGKFIRGVGVQAPHPDQQDDQAEARAARHASRSSEQDQDRVEADAAVRIETVQGSRTRALADAGACRLSRRVATRLLIRRSAESLIRHSGVSRNASSEAWNGPAGQAEEAADAARRESSATRASCIAPRKNRPIRRSSMPSSAAATRSATSAACGSSASTPPRASTA